MMATAETSFRGRQALGWPRFLLRFWLPTIGDRVGDLLCVRARAGRG